MEFLPKIKGGRVQNGAQLDGGLIVHAVAKQEGWYGSAACGAKCGKLSYGWDDTEMPINCPKCIKKIIH